MENSHDFQQLNALSKEIKKKKKTPKMQRGNFPTIFLRTISIMNHHELMHIFVTHGNCKNFLGLLCYLYSLVLNLKHTCAEAINVFDDISEKKSPLPCIPHLQEQLPEIDWTLPRIRNLIKLRILVKRARNCLHDASRKRGGKHRWIVCTNRDWKPFLSINYSHKLKQL